MEEKTLEQHIGEFRKDNADIMEALDILRVSSEEYLNALEAAYGVRTITASSTRV